MTNLTNINQVKTYADFMDFFNIKAILNNSVIENFFDSIEVFSGSLFDYIDSEGNYITTDEYEKDPDLYQEKDKEFYQYYIVSGYDAGIIADYTDDTVFYIPEIDLYLWGIEHWGTAWDCVPILLNF